MSRYSGVRVVAFDVDGTLYYNREVFLRSLPFAAANLRLVQAFAAVRRDIRRIRPIQDLRALQAEMTAERLGWRRDTVRNAIDRRIYGTWQRIAARCRAIPAAIDLLQALRDRGVVTVALSDFPVDAKLEALGIAGLFSHALCSEDTNYLKPNPEPFQLILDIAGVAPGEVLYVGNSYRYDVLGASALGLMTAHFAHHRRHGSAADLTFARYARLKTEILGIAR